LREEEKTEDRRGGEMAKEETGQQEM